MDLLNPALLFGSGLVAVPVVLHLIMRQRPRQIEFPALRFVRRAQETNRRTMRLRHWLLMLLRMAAIGLLAFALARPSVQSSGMPSLGFFADGEAPVAAALIVDTMPHMDYRHDNRTRLDAAKEMALWLLGQLPEESQVGIVDGDVGEAVFQVDVGAARQRLERLETSGTARPLPQALAAAMELLRDSDKRREVYLFTDLSQASWSAESRPALERLQKDLAATGLYVIDVGVSDPRNFSVGELRLSGQVLARNSPLTVFTDLSAIGAAGRVTVEAYIVNAKGQSEKRAAETIDVGPASAAGVELKIGALEEGTQQGHVRVVGGDGLAADNERYFTVEVRPAWPVLVVAQEPRQQQAYFYTQAVAPALFRHNGQARFDCQVVSYEQIAMHKLADFAAVVLLDPAALGDEVWNKLTTYALAGGGVAVCLGDEATDRESFNRPAAQELLPGKLEAIARFPDGDVHLRLDERPHPMLTKFRPLKDSIPWEEFPVYRYWRLGEMHADAGIVIPLNNQRPALIERIVGQGRALVLTTPISERPGTTDRDRWNLLPTGFEPWPFVMLANEMTLYLVGSRDEQLNYLAGQTVNLKLSPSQRPTTYLLRTPKGDALSRNTNPQQNSLVESTTAVAGNYRIEAGGEQGGLRRGFSVNLAPSATRLDRMDADELKKLFGEATLRLATTRDQIERNVATQRVGHELFPYLIALVAIVLGCEHVMANRFYRRA